MRRGQTEEQIPVNSALLNVVTPMGLEFQKNRLSVGENLGKIYGIIRYPQKVDVEWLSKLTNIPSTLVSIGFHPVDNGTLTMPYPKVWSNREDLQMGQKIHFPDSVRKRPPKMERRSSCRSTERVRQ